MARTFDGNTANYLSASTLPISSLPLTMACWVYVNDVTAGHTLMAFDNSPSGSEVFRLTAQGNASGDPIRCQVGDGSVDHINDTGAYSSGVWFHAAGTVSTASVDAYLNGSVGSDVSTTGTPAFFAGLDRFVLGQRIFSSAIQPLDGRLAWPCVWNVVLTAAEITALAKGAHPYKIRPGNIVSFWPLTGASDAGEIDQIGASDLSETGVVGVAESPLVSLGSPTFVTREAAVVGGTHPVNPFGHPFHGPFAGPIGF